MSEDLPIIPWIDRAPKEEVRKHFQGYGWNDYVESPDRKMKPLHRKNTKEQKQWYTEGWNTARTQEEQQGIVPFLLDELIKRMETGDEWYGTSFDGPIQIVKKIQVAYEGERKR